MTNRPIPRRGLLGCWFLSDRGITYNAGSNEAIDRSGQGNHATYQNGVTVGVSGDPERDFGAADFDAGSNQFAVVDGSLAVNGDKAIVAIAKTNTLSAPQAGRVIAGNVGGSEGDYIILDNGSNTLDYRVKSGSNTTTVRASVSANEYVSVAGVRSNGGAEIYVNNSLKDTTSDAPVGTDNRSFQIGREPLDRYYWNGEIAAVGRYDLSLPNAPEPSEIARKWDRLTDIPATR